MIWFPEDKLDFWPQKFIDWQVYMLRFYFLFVLLLLLFFFHRIANFGISRASGPSLLVSKIRMREKIKLISSEINVGEAYLRESEKYSKGCWKSWSESSYSFFRFLLLRFLVLIETNINVSCDIMSKNRGSIKSVYI